MNLAQTVKASAEAFRKALVKAEVKRDPQRNGHATPPEEFRSGFVAGWEAAMNRAQVVIAETSSGNRPDRIVGYQDLKRDYGIHEGDEVKISTDEWLPVEDSYSNFIGKKYDPDKHPPMRRPVEQVRCYMCDNLYWHPIGAVAGLGKCHDCFWEFEKQQMEELEHQN